MCRLRQTRAQSSRPRASTCCHLGQSESVPNILLHFHLIIWQCPCLEVTYPVPESWMAMIKSMMRPSDPILFALCLACGVHQEQASHVYCSHVRSIVYSLTFVTLEWSRVLQIFCRMLIEQQPFWFIKPNASAKTKHHTICEKYRRKL